MHLKLLPCYLHLFIWPWHGLDIFIYTSQSRANHIHTLLFLELRQSRAELFWSLLCDHQSSHLVLGFKPVPRFSTLRLLPPLILKWAEANATCSWHYGFVSGLSPSYPVRSLPIIHLSISCLTINSSSFYLEYVFIWFGNIKEVFMEVPKCLKGCF